MSETHSKDQSLQNGTVRADSLHSRAFQSSSEKRRTLLSLSSGAVGVFFLALTGKVDPIFTHTQRLAVGMGAVFFGLAILTGIAVLHSDAKTSYFWAQALQAKNQAKKDTYVRSQFGWRKARRVLSSMQLIIFVIGVIWAVVYTVARTWAL